MTSVHCHGLRKGTEDFRQEQKEAECQFLLPSEKKSIHFSFRNPPLLPPPLKKLWYFKSRKTVSRYKTEPQALNINSKCARSKGVFTFPSEEQPLLQSWNLVALIHHNRKGYWHVKTYINKGVDNKLHLRGRLIWRMVSEFLPSQPFCLYTISISHLALEISFFVLIFKVKLRKNHSNIYFTAVYGYRYRKRWLLTQRKTWRADI